MFEELYLAFREGRAEKDPSEFWFKGEIGFFDFYIIPLAKKLKECGVFGVSSAEYLDYAERNREEWIAKGESVVQELVAEIVPKVEKYLEAKASGTLAVEDQRRRSFDEKSLEVSSPSTYLTSSWNLSVSSSTTGVQEMYEAVVEC